MSAISTSQWDGLHAEVTPPLHKLSPTRTFCEGVHVSASMQEMSEVTLYLVTLEHEHNASTSIGTTSTSQSVLSNTAAELSSKSLLITCCVLVDAPDGSSMEARAILDSATLALFVSKRLSQSLRLPRSRQGVQISRIAGLSHNSPLQAVASLSISALWSPSKKFKVTAVVVPCVTCDLPFHPIPFDLKWRHLEGIPLANLDFSLPRRIDILLEVDIFIEVLHQGWWTGTPGSPSVRFRDKIWLCPRWKARCLCPKPLHYLSSCFRRHWRWSVAKVLGDWRISKGSILSHPRKVICCATLQRQPLTNRRSSFHCSSAQETTC